MKKKRKAEGKKQKTENGRERGGFKASRHGKRASAAGPKGEQKRAAEERERAGHRHTSAEASRFLRGSPISPNPIDGTENVADIEQRPRTECILAGTKD